MNRCIKNKKENTSTKPIKPFRQGNLDGYCGIYSAVNAIHYLWGPIGKDTGNDLLWKGLKYLESNRSAADRVSGGTLAYEIVKLLRNCYNKKYPNDVYRPFHRRRKVKLRDLLNHMDQFLRNNHGVIILGLEGKHSHWTVVTRMTRKSLILFDSSKMGRLSKSNCTTSESCNSRLHQILPTYQIYVSCKKGGKAHD